MAIDLPPVIPPQLSTVEKIEAQVKKGANVISGRVGGFELRISGNRYLSDEQIQRLIGAAKNPSQAIRAINQAYYQLGHLLVTSYYAQRGETIHVHVINGRLDKIEAPKVVQDHFEDLIGDSDLTAAEFEKHRILANLQARRMGVDYSISYSVGQDPYSYTLVFEAEPAPDYEAVDVILDVGNEGNRFVGRYFAGATIEQRFWEGAQLSLQYETAVTDWGETNGGRNYEGLNFELNQPFIWGFYGLELRRVEYERDVVLLVEGQPDTSLTCQLFPDLCNDTPTTEMPVVVDAETSLVALTGEQILLASRGHRLTLTERLEYIQSEIRLDDGRELLDEPHGSAEIGAKYFRRAELLNMPLRWSLQGFVEAGVTSDDGTLGTADNTADPEAVSATKRSAEYVLFKPKLGFKVGVAERLSLNFDFVSQFSDGKQVPQQQQFVLGGISTMSAWLPGVLIGDSGIYTRLNLVGLDRRLFGLPLEPSVFVELGQAWYEDVSGPLSDTRSLVDAGLRLKGEVGWGLEMELVAALPVSDDNFDSEALEDQEVDFYWHLKKRF